MDAMNTAGLGARRNEDIALDLLKFVAGVANVGRTGSSSTGFIAAGSAKPDDHVGELLSSAHPADLPSTAPGIFTSQIPGTLLCVKSLQLAL